MAKDVHALARLARPIPCVCELRPPIAQQRQVLDAIVSEQDHPGLPILGPALALTDHMEKLALQINIGKLDPQNLARSETEFRATEEDRFEMQWGGLVEAFKRFVAEGEDRWLVDRKRFESA
jgi:hypothetical protein